MKTILKFFAILFTAFLLVLSCDNENDVIIISDEPEKEDVWKLTWSDEFNGTEINQDNWEHKIGDGTLYGENPGWGNDQKQLYTSDPANSYITTDNEGNSVLVIEAIEDGADPKYPYTSARMTTENLQSFRYGKIEARIKLPYSQSIWPAFWTLGINKSECGWPGSGEIDIMEMLGNQEHKVTGNVHYIDENKRHNEELGTSIISSGKYSDDYHVYSIVWTPDSIKWFVDDTQYHEKQITDDMMEFRRSHYLILNIAVGGYWPGYPDETSVFPQKMFVDYVRVYEDTTLNAPEEVFTDPCEVMGGGNEIAIHAINSNFTDFHDVKIVSYGPGTSPDVSLSTVAVEGGSSVLATYPGGDWGGIWFQLNQAMDMSAYVGGDLVVKLNIPEEIVDFEVKLESHGGVGSVNLLDYPSTPLEKGYSEYTIPLSVFIDQGLSLVDLTIPFSLWNPKDAEGNYVEGDMFIDDLYFEE